MAEYARNMKTVCNTQLWSLGSWFHALGS